LIEVKAAGQRKCKIHPWLGSPSSFSPKIGNDLSFGRCGEILPPIFFSGASIWRLGAPAPAAGPASPLPLDFGQIWPAAPVLERFQAK
jgi:hypothetical protein